MKKDILLILCFIVIFGCNKNQQDEWDIKNTREISSDDDGLVRSKQRTKETLPYFINDFKKGQGEFFTKVKLSEAGETEHIWIRILKIEGDKSVGILENTPVHFKKIKYLDTLDFDISGAEDIMIVRNDSTIFGGFLQH